jgi:hypothetical protein
MSVRTRRGDRGPNRRTFRVGNPMKLDLPEYGRGMKSTKAYKLIKEKAERIDKIEPAGSVYVEDGEGSRYIVTFGDGRKAEVEFTDVADYEAGTIEEGTGSEIEPRNVQVVFDGAVDFFEGYDAADPKSIKEIRRDLIKRYGKLAKEWL